MFSEEQNSLNISLGNWLTTNFYIIKSQQYYSQQNLSTITAFQNLMLNKNCANYTDFTANHYQRKVVQAPGGASSLSLAWTNEKTDYGPRSSNVKTLEKIREVQNYQQKQYAQSKQYQEHEQGSYQNVVHAREAPASPNKHQNNQIQNGQGYYGQSLNVHSSPIQQIMLDNNHHQGMGQQVQENIYGYKDVPAAQQKIVSNHSKGNGAGHRAQPVSTANLRGKQPDIPPKIPSKNNISKDKNQVPQQNKSNMAGNRASSVARQQPAARPTVPQPRTRQNLSVPKQQPVMEQPPKRTQVDRKAPGTKENVPHNQGPPKGSNKKPEPVKEAQSCIKINGPPISQIQFGDGSYNHFRLQASQSGKKEGSGDYLQYQKPPAGQDSRPGIKINKPPGGISNIVFG